MFGLAQQWKIRGNNGFTSATITGERRVGKTMYALQTVFQICRAYLGMNETESWNTALNSVVFTMDDLVKIIKRHNYKNRRNFVIWDDSGVYGSGLLYQYNIDSAMVLKALMDTVGTRVRMMLLTCPDSEGLMKFLRRYQDYLININVYGATHGANGRLATVLKPYRAKNLARRWGRGWNDEFNVHIDNEIYGRYVEKRDSYADTIIKELLRHGKKGRRVSEETYGEDDQLVRQSGLLSDLGIANSEGIDPQV